MDDTTLRTALGTLYGGTTTPLRLAWQHRIEAEHRSPSGRRWPARPRAVALLGAIAGTLVLGLVATAPAQAEGSAAQAATTTVAMAHPVIEPRRAELTTHPLGQHPAIVARRLQASAGYDYASKFYPHPAWLYLSTTPRADETVPEERMASAQER